VSRSRNGARGGSLRVTPGQGNSRGRTRLPAHGPPQSPSHADRRSGFVIAALVRSRRRDRGGIAPPSATPREGRSTPSPRMVRGADAHRYRAQQEHAQTEQRVSKAESKTHGDLQSRNPSTDFRRAEGEHVSASKGWKTSHLRHRVHLRPRPAGKPSTPRWNRRRRSQRIS